VAGNRVRLLVKLAGFDEIPGGEMIWQVEMVHLPGH